MHISFKPVIRRRDPILPAVFIVLLALSACSDDSAPMQQQATDPVVNVVPTGNQASGQDADTNTCLLYTSPSPRDATLSRMPSSA